MANQRQSSDRGCTQRGAYRRNTLLGLSQLATVFAVVVTWFASGESLAQTTTQTLRVDGVVAVTCPSTSTSVFDFSVTGSYGPITDLNTPVKIQVVAMPLTSGTNLCPSTFVGTKGAVLGDPAFVDVTNLATGANLIISTPLTFTNAPTIATLCDHFTSTTVATGSRWVACAYVTTDASKIVASTVPNPVTIYGSSGGGSTTATAPVIKDVVAGDGQISFTASTNKGDTSFEVCYVEGESNLAALVAAKTCSGGNLQTRTVTGTSIVLDNLSNDIVYYFKVGATNGNLWSAVEGPVTPSKAYSTLEIYDGASGGTSWKCDQGQGRFSLSSIVALFGFLATAFWLSPRRRGQARRIFASLGVIAFFVLAAPSAQADIGQLNLGLFGGPYKPSLDANTTFKTYKCLFADAILPMLGGELDVHLGDPFGSFQFGTAIGYSWANGKALKTFNASDTNCDSQVFSDTSVALHMLQIRPRLSYVFDPYVEDFPFVPFVRAGLVGGGYYFTYQGKADIRGQDKDINPLGIRFGWEASFGLMFLLDVIEQSVADRARGAGTYDHSYLKAEISYQSIDDFGNPGPNFSPASIVGAPTNFLGTLALVIQFQ